MSSDFATFDDNTSPEEFMAAIEGANVQGVTNYTTIVGMPPGAVCALAESEELVVFENGTMFADWVADLNPDTMNLVNGGMQSAFGQAAWDGVEHVRPEIGQKMEVTLS